MRISSIPKPPETGSVLFAGSLHATGYGPANMSYAFPEAGEYEMTVRFVQNGKSIVETTVPVAVAKNESASRPFMDFLSLTSLITIVIGLGAGIVLGIRFSRKSAGA